MKCLLLLLIALAWLMISSNTVLGCQCAEYGRPVCAAYWRSDAVFVGQLRDITPPDRKSTDTFPTATLHFIDALPKTPSGKIQRYLLRSRRRTELATPEPR